MTATNRRSGTRRKNDFYPTPAYAVHALLNAWRLARNLPGPWLECCAGNGAIIRAVNQWFSQRSKAVPYWTAVELDSQFEPWLEAGLPQGTAILTGRKFQAYPRPDMPIYEVCWSNPPFSESVEIIDHALAFARYVVMLEKITFLGTQERHEWWQEHPAEVFVLSKRPFSDATEYAWFVWGTGRKELHVI